MSLIDDFENSFQACMAPITNPTSSHVLDNDEMKANLDNIQRFLEVSQQIENFFIRKRAMLSDQKPEFLLNDEINELKNEINRKDQLLSHYYEKLNTWNKTVNDALNGKYYPSTSVPGGPNMFDNSGNQVIPNMPPGQVMRVPHIPNLVPSPMAPSQHIPHVGSPMMRQQSTGGPSGMVPSPGVQQVPNQQQPHPVVFNSMQSPAQTPLGYLERTTANIGMNDNRR